MGRATLTLTNLCNNNCNNVTLINFIQIFNVNNWYSDLIVLDFIGILLSEAMAGIWPTLCISTQVNNKCTYLQRAYSAYSTCRIDSPIFLYKKTSCIGTPEWGGAA